MVACWYLWTWRNKEIFEEGFQRPTDPTYVVLKMAKEIEGCFNIPWICNQHDTIFIGWKRPLDGWVKLNCDGSQNKNSIGLAGCGGLLRDSDGRWIKGYSRKLGDCDALHAEMWGMYLGLDLAHQQGIKKLHVESDSKVLIDMVTKKKNFNGNIPTLVRRIRQLLQLNWQVHLSHTWREGNRSADWLANFSYTLSSFDVHFLESPPRELQSLLFDDISGACMPRNVRLTL
jgi:ribonuclease HI